MDTPIVVVLIATAASAITFLLTKMKERETEWRKLRIDQYKELISAMSNVAGNPSDEDRKRLALAANHVALYASPEVLRYLTQLLIAVASAQLERHDEILTLLMHAIRADLKVPGANQKSEITFKLWAVGGSDKRAI